MANANQTIVSVQKAVFSASGHPTESHLLDLKLYDDPILVKDVLASRGAATLLQYAPAVIVKMNAARIRGTPEYKEMEELAKSVGFNISITREEPTTQQIIDTMHNWTGMLSFSGKPYESLSATLLNLPKNIPFDYVFGLSDHKLLEPLLSRSSVLLAGIFAEAERRLEWSEGDKLKAEAVFFRSKDLEIKKANI